MHLLRRMVLVATFVSATLAAMPAMAQFTVCNKSASAAYVSVGHWDNSSYVTEGWWTVQPGACTITHPGPLQWQWYYLYAETGQDATGNYQIWSGDIMLCIHRPNGFTIVGNTDCDTGFYEIDTGTEKEWTFTLE